jgi:serine/threonine protein kinase
MSNVLFNTGKPVAIKVVSLATIYDAQAKGVGVSLLNELRMARRLNKASKHIVRMYDFHVDRQNGLSFLVMELGQQDLEKYLAQRSALSSVERKAIWRQLVDIAITLYQRQIVISFCRNFIQNYFTACYRYISILNLIILLYFLVI